MIPFLDMKRMHEPLAEEFLNSFKDILARSAFTNGPEVEKFEKEFAAYVGTSYCVGMSSGLDAEVIGLRTLGLKPGDRVIVPAMTFIATVEAVTQAGGVPALVDVDRAGLIDLQQTESALEAGARFIVPVHLFGQLVDAEKLRELARRYNAIIFEDACQAHGAASLHGVAGAIGKASAFSFYPGKNLGALGDAGALCTNDREVYEMARALREHGQTKKYYHEYEGYTARLDNLQAAFLSTKLKKMREWTTQRISAAKYYSDHLRPVRSIQVQGSDFSGGHVYHLFVILTEKREKLAEEFKKRGIGFGFHYPIAIHRLACYLDRPWAKGDFPMAEKYADQAISLPIFPGIIQAEQDQVIEGIKSVCS